MFKNPKDPGYNAAKNTHIGEIVYNIICATIITAFSIHIGDLTMVQSIGLPIVVIFSNKTIITIKQYSTLHNKNMVALYALSLSPFIPIAALEQATITNPNHPYYTTLTLLLFCAYTSLLIYHLGKRIQEKVDEDLRTKEELKK